MQVLLACCAFGLQTHLAPGSSAAQHTSTPSKRLVRVRRERGPAVCCADGPVILARPRRRTCWQLLQLSTSAFNDRIHQEGCGTCLSGCGLSGCERAQLHVCEVRQVVRRQPKHVADQNRAPSAARFCVWSVFSWKQTKKKSRSRNRDISVLFFSIIFSLNFRTLG